MATKHARHQRNADGGRVSGNETGDYATLRGFDRRLRRIKSNPRKVSRPVAALKRSISRILCPIRRLGGDHFSRPLIAQRLKQPTRETGDEPPLYGLLRKCASSEACHSLLDLAPAGGCLAGHVTVPPVSSYLTFSPSPSDPVGSLGSLFLWPCSAHCCARPLAGSVLGGVRTFLVRIESARDHLDLLSATIVALEAMSVKAKTGSRKQPAYAVSCIVHHDTRLRLLGSSRSVIHARTVCVNRSGNCIDQL
ncbi:hypothetical protein GPROT1_02792 [Gammaproteobacteria bacterium]|nr:hypothetical protein GPROT1_02792 [Gammaproteobacteria bacterium]